MVHYIMLRQNDTAPVNVSFFRPRGSQQDMIFLHYLSFLGVQQHIRPSHIFIHGDVLPSGEWWRRTVTDVANIFFVNVTDHIPTQIYGKPLQRIEHRTDILRYQIVYRKAACFFCIESIYSVNRYEHGVDCPVNSAFHPSGVHKSSRPIYTSLSGCWD